jgi:Emfourin
MRIELTRSGGFAGLRINRTFDTATMPQQEAQELAGLVDAAGFFDLPGSMRSPGADQLQYKISIEKDGQAHCVEADERAMPPKLSPLVKRLMAAARNQK